MLKVLKCFNPQAFGTIVTYQIRPKANAQECRNAIKPQAFATILTYQIRLKANAQDRQNVLMHKHLAQF